MEGRLCTSVFSSPIVTSQWKLQEDTVGIFIPWKWANTTHHTFPSGMLVVHQNATAHCHFLTVLSNWLKPLIMYYHNHDSLLYSTHLSCNLMLIFSGNINEGSVFEGFITGLGTKCFIYLSY